MSYNSNKPTPMGLSLIYDKELDGGWYSIDSMINAKGYAGRQDAFNVHYVIYWNTDAVGDNFYNCKLRRK